MLMQRPPPPAAVATTTIASAAADKSMHKQLCLDISECLPSCVQVQHTAISFGKQNLSTTSALLCPRVLVSASCCWMCTSKIWSHATSDKSKEKVPTQELFTTAVSFGKQNLSTTSALLCPRVLVSASCCWMCIFKTWSHATSDKSKEKVPHKNCLQQQSALVSRI